MCEWEVLEEGDEVGVGGGGEGGEERVGMEGRVVMGEGEKGEEEEKVRERGVEEMMGRGEEMLGV
ncbi:hypothetical protein [Micrococcus luteus]|uniref:hypothetical protein n=1 Tax=Micrococcus luteus TaxID=1270 RepID=UPI0016427F11|nr:hypothetical protein [Micrococcus luteus]